MIAGILLAAGSGSRFGAHKLLHRLEGVAIAEHAARHLIAAVPVSVAVVRPGDAELGAMLKGLGLIIIECATAGQGMGASIACGVSATRNADGWVIALADMPWIQPQTLYTVAQQLRAGAGIAAPLYQGQRGHPVGFAAEFGTRLSALHQDTGAHEIIAAARERLILIPTGDAGVLRDIDIPADVGSEAPN